MRPTDELTRCCEPERTLPEEVLDAEPVRCGEPAPTELRLEEPPELRLTLPELRCEPVLPLAVPVRRLS